MAVDSGRIEDGEPETVTLPAGTLLSFDAYAAPRYAVSAKGEFVSKAVSELAEMV